MLAIKSTLLFLLVSILHHGHQVVHGCEEIDPIACYGSDKTPLYRYWNGGLTDHFYETNYDELGGGKSGWASEGTEASIFKTKIAGTVPLYRLWNGKLTDHLYTTDPKELNSAGGFGWAWERIIGYVDPSPDLRLGTVPLYRYWNGGIIDHFYTPNYNELGEGKSGWGKEGIVGYVCPKDIGNTPPKGYETNQSNGEAGYITVNYQKS